MPASINLSQEDNTQIRSRTLKHLKKKREHQWNSETAKVAQEKQKYQRKVSVILISD